MQHKKQTTVAGNLDNVSICTSTTKTFGNCFPLAYGIGTFICWYVDFRVHVDSILWKSITIWRKKLRPLSKKIFLASDYYLTCVIFLLFRYPAKIYYMETVSGFNFSIKILLAKITLFWINMSSVCIGSISWCCFVVMLFRWFCCSHVSLFRGLPVFCCSASVPVFRQFSGVPLVFCQCYGVRPVFCFL